MEVAPATPRNVDGTLWKNPLNRWTNKPEDNKITEAGTRIAVLVAAKTNCWRKSYPHPHVIQDNAPYYWHKVSQRSVVCL
jgi:regulation of enolase protein 1 (concanavalin A-like superfamily)